jgi:tRNA1Val (adenine37-N6)-methyltransferase
LNSTKNSIFRFKQFEVDQTGCAMKINTDGTLLGALSNAIAPSSILDIGAGTGVVALMLAQRFSKAQVHAVEIEEKAAERSLINFRNSPFSDRLRLHACSFQQLSIDYPFEKFDLIVSNPPFFINALKNTDEKKQTARHSDDNFYTELIDFMASHLSSSGVCTLVLPIDTALIVKELVTKKVLFISNVINVRSFADSQAHRQILTISRNQAGKQESEFVIYSTQKEYSEQFVNSLKEFFTIF